MIRANPDKSTEAAEWKRPGFSFEDAARQARLQAAALRK
jgi:hypothetical protein